MEFFYQIEFFRDELTWHSQSNYWDIKRSTIGSDIFSFEISTLYVEKGSPNGVKKSRTFENQV